MADRKPPKRELNWGRLSKTLSFWLLIILIPIAFFRLSGGAGTSPTEIDYTQYSQELDRGNVSKVSIQDGKVITVFSAKGG